MIRRDWWWDVVPATVVAVAGTLGAIHIEAEAGERTADGVTFVLVGVASAALLGRRRRPLPTLVVVMAALVAYTLRNDPGGPVYLAGPVALYSLAVARPRVVGYIAAAAVTAVQVVARVIADGDGLALLDLLFAGWAAVAVLAADAMRARQERMRHQEDEDRRRVAEERLQLARDLHDSVAHSMAAINVQSGVAAHVLARRPEQAARSARGDPRRQPRRCSTSWARCSTCSATARPRPASRRRTWRASTSSWPAPDGPASTWTS